MPRIFGALAVFGGWLCILLSALLGLVATEFLGLGHIEGELPPSGIYGVPTVVVLWALVAIAVLTILPVTAATFAPDPRRPLYGAAATMAIVGLALLPDELGRACAAAILPGAALFAIGGRLIHEAGPIDATAGERAAPEPAMAGHAAEPAMAGPTATELAGHAAEPAMAGHAAEPSMAAPTATEPAGHAAEPSAQSDGPECPWCSARISAGAERCPSCGAALKSEPAAEAGAIPGVTAVSPELLEYADKVAVGKKRPGLLSLMFGERDDRVMTTPGDGVDPGVFKPPSDEVRAEMERLDREIAAGTQAETVAAEPPQPTPEATAEATAAPLEPETAARRGRRRIPGS